VQADIKQNHSSECVPRELSWGGGVEGDEPHPSILPPLLTGVAPESVCFIRVWGHGKIMMCIRQAGETRNRVG